jgi:hypothetical protein
MSQDAGFAHKTTRSGGELKMTRETIKAAAIANVTHGGERERREAHCWRQ